MQIKVSAYYDFTSHIFLLDCVVSLFVDFISISTIHNNGAFQKCQLQIFLKPEYF